MAWLRIARYIGVIALAYLVVFWLIYSGGFMHRQAFDKAVVDWVKNPTAENEAALKREQHINHLIRLHDSSIGAAILVGLGCGVWAIAHFVKPKKR